MLALKQTIVMFYNIQTYTQSSSTLSNTQVTKLLYQPMTNKQPKTNA